MSAKPISSNPIRFEHVGDGVLKRMADVCPSEYADCEVVIRYSKSPNTFGEKAYRPLATCDPIDAILIAVLSFRPEINGLNFQCIDIVHRPLQKT